MIRGSGGRPSWTACMPWEGWWNMDRHDIKVLGLVLLVAAVIFVFDFLSPRGVAVWLAYPFLLIPVSRMMPRLFSILLSGICSVLIAVGFFASAPGLEDWNAAGNAAGQIGVVWLVEGLLARQKKEEREREDLIAQLTESLARVRQLSGLLPICASCKKIRDDRGYWNQLEVYIRDHSEADFTHGLCPDCVGKLLSALGEGERGSTAGRFAPEGP
jgi:hypothetical protein